MELNVKIDRDVLFRLESYLNSLKEQWDQLHPKKSIKKTYILDSAIFLLSVIDDLIVFVQKHIEKGPDKKVVVMSMSSEVFDHIVINAFPLWLRPLAPVIKEIIVGVILDQMIEFIVSKYKEGSWVAADKKDVPPDEIPLSIVYKSKKEVL